MPLPFTITWFQAEPGVDRFDIHDETTRLRYFITLIDCHAEVLARPGPSEQDIRFGFGPSSYYLKRSSWIQEHLLDLYINALQGGTPNRGYFYGVFSEVGVWREIDSIRFNGSDVYAIEGGHHQYHRIGLLYSLVPLTPTNVNEAPPTRCELLGLPTRMLELMDDRETFDRLINTRIEPTPETATHEEPIERRSRYTRPPVI